MRQPGIEPGSIAWKATMLTFTPPTLYDDLYSLWNISWDIMTTSYANKQIKRNTPNVGLEPTTPRLRGSCSTDWASRDECADALVGIDMIAHVDICPHWVVLLVPISCSIIQHTSGAFSCISNVVVWEACQRIRNRTKKKHQSRWLHKFQLKCVFLKKKKGIQVPARIELATFCV